MAEVSFLVLLRTIFSGSEGSSAQRSAGTSIFLGRIFKGFSNVLDKEHFIVLIKINICESAE